VVAVVGFAGAADVVVGPSHTDADGGRGQEAPPLGIEIRRVELWRAPVPTVRLHASGPITPRLIDLAAQRDLPPRLRILLDATIAPRARRAIGGSGVVRGITVEQVRAREAAITVTLAAPVRPRVRRSRRVVAIELAAAAPSGGPVLAGGGAPGRPPAAPPEPAAGMHDAAISLERGGAPFVWPDLDAPWYADPAAAVERLALKGWRQGGMTPDAPADHTDAAGRYLAADVTYLRTLMGQMQPLDAVAAYDRALRSAPGFADAPRALAMIGFASLRLGFAPEADTAFRRVLDEHPESPYANVARVGRATALRQRRRFDEARAALAAIPEPVPAALRCDVLAERAALARDAGHHADAVPLDERVAAECPRFDGLPTTALARADSLLAIGRRADARALLTRSADRLDVAAQAAHLTRAAELARLDGDLVAARAALERALGLRIGFGDRIRIQARLARIDAMVGPERALATLENLATAAPPSVRGDVVGVIAETLADADRHADALARLTVPEEASPDEVEAVLTRRDAILARWIEHLAAADDAAGTIALYARHRTAVDTRAGAATARRVADALRRMALPAPALRLLRLRDRGEDPTLSVALADAAVAAGEPAIAGEVLARLVRDGLPDALRAEHTRVAARLALAEGHPERVADGALDDELGRALGRAWTARGDAALAREAWREAAAAYAHAHAASADPTIRLVAAAGLLAARAGTDAAPAARAADELATIDDPVVRRAASAVVATRDFGHAPPGRADGRP
jgi:tetratricopeptide (TPR) repeat protein